MADYKRMEPNEPIDKIMRALVGVLVVAVVLVVVGMVMAAHPEWWNPSYWGL